MEIYNLNDEVRNNLVKIIDKYLLNGMTLNESVEKFRDRLYVLENAFEYKVRLEREYYISIMYIDAIKMTIYKHKELLSNDSQMVLLDRLNEIVDISDLLAEVSFDFDLFSNIILNCYEFSKMNSLTRSMVIKSLSPLENKWISDKICYHNIDLFTYNKSITIEDLINSLEKEIKYQSKYFDIDLSYNNILTITSLIRKLNCIDRENATELIVEIGKVDYAVCKYLIKYINDSDLLLDHIDYYEGCDLNDILYRLTTDEVFLKDAIWMLISFYIDKSYEGISLENNVLNTVETSKVNKKMLLE